MKRLVLSAAAIALLSGCHTEVNVEGVDGKDLYDAYRQCVGEILPPFEHRLACTAAVYGGPASSPWARPALNQGEADE